MMEPTTKDLQDTLKLDEFIKVDYQPQETDVGIMDSYTTYEVNGEFVFKGKYVMNLYLKAIEEIVEEYLEELYSPEGYENFDVIIRRMEWLGAYTFKFSFKATCVAFKDVYED